VLPTYLSSLEPEPSVAWSGDVWAVPGAIGLTAGSLIFTSGGEWLGVSADDGSRLIIVPADTLLRRSDELRKQASPAADLGLSVQSLRGDIAAATGAAAGVIVTWVDPGGPSADVILVGDVIESIDGHAVPTVRAWSARTGRLAAGAPIRLQVRRSGAPVDVTVTGSARNEDHLGLTLARAGAGSRVVRIAAGSAAERAGLLPGDLLSAVGASTALSPADLERRFTSLKPTGTLLLSVTRGNDHHIAVLTR
jgi:S1-C subfamily serine protease